MDCGKIKNLLSSYLDNQLDLPERSLVEKHLESCQDCLAYYRQLLRLQEAADDFRLDLPETYWLGQKETVIDKIEAAESSRILRIMSRTSRSTIYKLAALAASIALVAIVTIFETRKLKPGGEALEEAPVIHRMVELLPGESTGDSISSIPYGPESSEISPAGERPAAKEEEETPSVEPLKKARDVGPAAGEPRIATLPERSPVPSAGKPAKNEAEAETEEMKLPPAQPARRDKKAIDEYFQPAVPESVQIAAADRRKEVIKTASTQLPPADELIAPAAAAGVVDTGRIHISLQERAVKKDVVSSQMTAQTESSAIVNPVAEPKIEMENYNTWKKRLDSLQTEYDRIILAAKEKYAVKSNLKALAIPRPDSSEAIIGQLSEALFNVGILTSSGDERKDIMARLKALRGKATASSYRKIDSLISILESLR
jgi:hypothetical protein